MQPNCSKCAVGMESGFMLDLGHGNLKHLPIWIAGEPERGFWTGLKTNDRANLEVRTYRCPKCGLLESYALNPAR